MATNTKNPTTTAIGDGPAVDTTTKKTEVDNPKKPRTPTLPDTSTPAADLSVPFEAKPQPAAGGTEGATNGADSKEKGSPVATETVPSLLANNVEKKLRRAERFGVPLQLSEQEKRSSRAERFGTVSGSDVAKSSEELKRKARAERFGLSANSAADEEAKKKARLARFGSNVKIDTQEEEKRKARALRFAESPLSFANGKGNVQMVIKNKTTGTGNVVGGT